MTLKEISEKYGYSEGSIKKNFPKTAAAIQKKYGVTLFKVKDGKTKQVFYYAGDKRAKSMYEELQEKFEITNESLKLTDYQFLLFLGLAVMPMRVFRGFKTEFLDYIEIPNTKKNLDKLDNALKDLSKLGYFSVIKDGEKLVIYINWEIERKLSVETKILKECKKIVEKYNKNNEKVSQLIKVWLAFQICLENVPFTYKDVMQLTGLSLYQVRDAKKILVKEGAFEIKRVGKYLTNLGWDGDENAIYNCVLKEEK